MTAGVWRKMHTALPKTWISIWSWKQVFPSQSSAILLICSTWNRGKSVWVRGYCYNLIWKYSLIMLERRDCPGKNVDWQIWGSHVCSWFKRLSVWRAPDSKPFAFSLLVRGRWVRFPCPRYAQSSSPGGAPQESNHTKHLLFCRCLSERLWKVLS